MGWISDRQDETTRRVAEQLLASVPPGETLCGVVLANQQKTFSASLMAVGVTERHLIVQPVTRAPRPVRTDPSEAEADVAVSCSSRATVATGPTLVDTGGPTATAGSSTGIDVPGGCTCVVQAAPSNQRSPPLPAGSSYHPAGIRLPLMRSRR